MKMKLKRTSSISQDGLYALEEIFGDSDGHGCGFGGENIAWYIDHKTKAKSYKRLEVTMAKNEIEITYARVFDNESKDDQILELDELPEKWKKRVQTMFAIHCEKPA